MLSTLQQVNVASPESLANANPVFLPEQCYWPETIGVDEEFEGKLLVQNQGDAGQVWLGIEYKGKDYIFQLDDQETIPLDADQALEAKFTGSMRDFFGDVESWEQSKTLDLTFITGYLAEENYVLTDSWNIRCYVTVSSGFPIPMWGIAVAGAVAGGSLIAWGIVSR
jgi:hypothetical protein